GVATETLEVLEDQPDLQVLIIPVGGGSGVAGACIVARTVKPGLKIIAVQSQESPAAFRSWNGRRLVEAPDGTLAEGLATGTAFALPQKIMRKYLDEFILVSDEEILRAMVWMAEHAHTLAEAAGAASLAAAYKLRRRLKGKKTGIICSGGNTSLQQLKLAVDSVET
ncbi:pyridoxal-phosphate dependent enzyme, partial [candidate division KSB1 bacterium]